MIRRQPSRYQGNNPRSQSSPATQQPQDWRPIPDPTELTQKLVSEAIIGFREVVETRLNAMDRATDLVADRLDNVKGDIQTQRTQLLETFGEKLVALERIIRSDIDNVRQVNIERFLAVDREFKQRDDRGVHTEEERRRSLDAAFAAAKEAAAELQKANTQAIAKSEVNAKETVAALSILMTTKFQVVENIVNEHQRRLDRGEAGDEATTMGRTEQRLNVGQVLQAMSVVIAAIALAIGLALGLR
jgi:hypothetical protein